MGIGRLGILVLLMAGAGLPGAAAREAVIENIIDGDTVKLQEGTAVRLIGVNCPEIDNRAVNDYEAARLDVSMLSQEIYGRKAKEFLEKRTAGKKIRLERDPAYDAIDHTDPMGRSLAYIYQDEELLNLGLIEQGYCSVYPKLQFQFRERFLKAEREARDAQRGIWSERV